MTQIPNLMARCLNYSSQPFQASLRRNLRQRVAVLLESDRASIVFGTIVILNAVLIGYEVDSPGGTVLTGKSQVNFVLIVLFSV